MRFDEFAKQLLKTIDKLSISEQKSLPSDIFHESHETVTLLRKLLSEYSSNTEEIVNIEQLAPFYDFLKYRWARIAGTKSSYKLKFKTTARLYCEALGNALIMLANKIESYKSRNLDSILMPVIPMSLFT
ncbi:MAG: hypothetical protein JO149_09840, partial [Gammaproteobacteria bacterium]|nr:hypothetical protein [Gammaproteobacteria bacterium]